MVRNADPTMPLMSSARHIVVIGSANMDLVCRISRMPRGGETVLGEGLGTIPGGKGANQAVAAAKLAKDTQVHLLARVGDDDFGQRLLNGLVQHRVNTEHVTITEGVPSGCAVILVDKRGENSIVVAPGANALLTSADVDRAGGLLAGAAAVVLQLEIPLETVLHAIELCRQLGVPTILDPVPVPPRGLPRELYRVDMLAPNQGEAELLVGRQRTHGVKSKKLRDPKQIAGTLVTRGPKTVVVKLGPRGALIEGRDGHIERVRSFKVSVQDTTAAGDAFIGALAVGESEGMPLRDSVRFANAAGAACFTEFGAQPALPSRQEVDRILKTRT